MTINSINQTSPIDIALAGIVLGFGIIQIAEAKDDAEDAKDDLLDFLQRKLDVTLRLKDFWVDNQHAQKTKVIDDALAMEVPVLTKTDAEIILDGMVGVLVNQAKAIKGRLINQYNVCTTYTGDRNLDIAGADAASNSMYSLLRSGERRTERRRVLKRRIVQSAHAASFTDPTVANALLDDAISIANSDLQAAYTHLAGGAALAGVGAGLLTGDKGSKVTNSTNARGDLGSKNLAPVSEITIDPSNDAQASTEVVE